MNRETFESMNTQMLADAARNPAMSLEHRKLAATILQERGAEHQIQHPQIASLLWIVAADAEKSRESAKKHAKRDNPEPTE